MFSMWIVVSGVSLGTRTKGLLSLSCTSAALRRRLSEYPVAIPARVFMLHGMTTIPWARNVPLAGGRRDVVEPVHARREGLHVSQLVICLDGQGLLRSGRDDEVCFDLLLLQDFEQPYAVDHAASTGHAHEQNQASYSGA